MLNVFNWLIGNRNAAGQTKRLDPEAFMQAVKEGTVQLIDVRTPVEFKEGHLPHAINMNFFDPAGFGSKAVKLDKSKPVYIYCRSGHRSAKAGRKLLSLGFSSVFDLRGGIMAIQGF